MFMSSHYKMIRQLGQLADLGFELAGKLQRDARAAETPRTKADLALAFTAVADEVRRAIALEARLVREWREADAAAGVTPRPRARYRRAEPKPEAAAPVVVPPDTIKH
ncbi:MAG: hypothetical protein JWP86_180 [Phenylobacterium sp.]|nr:hypothetical protein [Phenylobacterium sp.]MDB5492843.1 hypothetical protein [Phenylobacterium sp.]